MEFLLASKDKINFYLYSFLSKFCSLLLSNLKKEQYPRLDRAYSGPRLMIKMKQIMQLSCKMRVQIALSTVSLLSNKFSRMILKIFYKKIN